MPVVREVIVLLHSLCPLWPWKWINMICRTVVKGNTTSDPKKKKAFQEYSGPKSRLSHISRGWSSNDRKCTLCITVLSHCFSFFLGMAGHSTHQSCMEWSHWYCEVAHREGSWCQQRRRGTLEAKMAYVTYILFRFWKSNILWLFRFFFASKARS